MASYVGSQRNPGHLIEVGERVKSAFHAVRHKALATDVKKFLAEWSRYVAAQKSRDAALAKEDAARSQLADADAARDAAVLVLDRTLIGDGAPKKNSFKRFGGVSPSRLVALRYADESKAVHALVKAVLAQKDVSAAVTKAAKSLMKANETVVAAEARVEALVEVSTKTLRARDAVDRPLRAALSVLKLQVRLAEQLGLQNAYVELFAIE